MAIGNALNINQSGLVNLDATAGVFSAVNVPSKALLVGGSANAITGVILNDGQLAIGSTSNNPVAANLTAGSGVSITNASGSITIATAGGGTTWNDSTTTPVSLLVNNGYVADNASLVTFTLPTTAAFGSVIKVVGYGSGGWIIAQNAGQQIRFANASSTVGTGGSLASSNLNDSVCLLAVVGGTNTLWTVIHSVGNLTII